MAEPKEVTIIDFTKFDVAQLPELKGKKDEIKKIIKANPIVKVTDNASYELAKKSRTAVKTLRTSLEKEKKDVNDRIKNNVLVVVANEYDLLIEGVRSDENARQEGVTAWEEVKENERLEKLRLEQERIDGIKKSISDFFSKWSGRIGSLQFANLEDFDAEFGETLVNYDKSELQEYEVLFTDSVSNLTYMLSEKKANLVAQENIRIEQERLKIQGEIATWFRIWSDRIIGSTSSVKCQAYFKEFNEEKVLNCGEYQAEYGEKRSELVSSFEKRIEMLKTYETQQAEQKAIEEKNRIAQEKLESERKQFEQQQAEAKFQERKKHLIEIGMIDDGKESVFLGDWIYKYSDIKENDDYDYQEVVKNVSIIIKTTQEVEFEEEKVVVEMNDGSIKTVPIEESGELIADSVSVTTTKEMTKEAIIGEYGIDPFTTWQTVYDEFANDTDTIYLDKASSYDLLNWLEERFNCPISKI